VKYLGTKQYHEEFTIRSSVLPLLSLRALLLSHESSTADEQHKLTQRVNSLLHRRAIALSGTQFMGRPIKVSFGQPKKS
jgi:hypothetical protein